MKKFILSLTVLSLLAPLVVFAQEMNFDDDFLDSLPESVKDDIISEGDANFKEDQKKISRRPSSKLSKLETVKRWEDFQKKELYDNNKSDRYGLNLFLTMQSSFMPVNEPNFDSSYLLDFGDIISINITGNLQIKLKDNSFKLDRDGSIFIPNIGKIILSGLSLENAGINIQKRISDLYVGAEVFVSLLNIRDINILIAGHANYPGLYTFNGNTNIFHALAMGGGIKENGSIRNIELKRDGEVIHVQDLYKTLILGDTSDTIPLRSGDVILVKPVQNIVTTGSGFNIEASFELKDNETFKDLYLFAGGATKFTTGNLLFLNRFIGESFVSSELPLNDILDMKIKHGDNLSIKTNSFSRIEITGKIANPGFYNVSEGANLSDLVKMAGGYRADAYMYGSYLFREKAKELEKASIKKTYQNLINYVANNPTELGDISGLQFILSEMIDVAPQGRVIAEFDPIKIERDPFLDTLLSDNDKVVIAQYDENVYIFGEVLRPGAVRFSDELTLKSYINNSGGATNFADNQHIYIVSPNGEAQIIKNTLGFLNQRNIDIYPGSVIYIPRELGKLRSVELFSIAAPIFSSFALTLASLNSLNND